MDIYSHVIPSMKEEATEEMEAAIFGAAGE